MILGMDNETAMRLFVVATLCAIATTIIFPHSSVKRIWLSLALIGAILLAPDANATPTIQGHNGTATGVDLPANGAYTIRHWQSGKTYQRNTAQGRTVTVPHTDGTLIVEDADGYRVALSEIEPGWQGRADRWGTRERADRQGVALEDHDATLDRHDRRIKGNSFRLNRNDTRINRNRERLDRHAGRIQSNTQRLDRHAAGIAGAVALASHSLSGPGLRLSVAGGAFAGHSAVSTAVSYGGDRGSVSLRYARSGGEAVYGGAVEWRVWE